MSWIPGKGFDIPARFYRGVESIDSNSTFEWKEIGARGPETGSLGAGAPADWSSPPIESDSESIDVPDSSSCLKDECIDDVDSIYRSDEEAGEGRGRDDEDDIIDVLECSSASSIITQ